MPKHGKNYNKLAALIERFSMRLVTRIELVLQSTYAKFDETFDVAMRLGVDPRHADQMIRSSVDYPMAPGK